MPAKIWFLAGCAAALSLPSIAVSQPTRDEPEDVPLMTLSADEGHIQYGLVDGDAIDVEIGQLVLFGMLGTWAGIIPEDTRVGDIECAAGGSVRFRMGILQSCALAESWVAQHGTLPPGTIVELADGTSIRHDMVEYEHASFRFFRARLPEATAYGDFTYAAGVELVFNPDGTVWKQSVMPLTEPLNHQQLPCRFGTEDDRALLYPDRSVAQCALSEAHEIDGVEVPQHSVIYLDESGSLYRVDLHQDWLLGEAIFRSGNHVDFEDGEVINNESRFVVEDPTELQRQSWRVSEGYFHGYPWVQVLQR